MKFGYCAPWDKAEVIARAGFDYIEPPVAGALSPDDPWEKTPYGAASSGPLPAEVFNVLLPRDLPIVGPGVDHDHVRRYVESTFHRLSVARAEVVVFGSGRSRHAPEGFPSEAAREQIEAFLHQCASLAAVHGITLVIEPLGPAECNVITSLTEAVAYARAVNADTVRVLCDIYHRNGDAAPEVLDDYADVREAACMLRHVHVAGSRLRRVPTHDDIEYLARFFRVLKEIGYDGRISIEARTADLASEAGVGLETVRTAWDLA